jgi:threonine/homoserine/homoserine lactone efflux protein
MDWVWPLAVYAFAASITPGPNNLMLAASGVAFGVRRTVPHMLGIPAGFASLLLLCALGVGALVLELPTASLALKIAGSAYLVYLTWTMRRAFDVDDGHSRARPLRFYEAFLFQFANPKGWLIALTAASVFLPPDGPTVQAIMVFCSVFVVINVPCIATWVTVGSTARHFVRNARWRRVLGGTIVLLMTYTIVAIWI